MNWLMRKYWYFKLKQSHYRPLFGRVDRSEYISLDCETTSLDPNHAELVTIAATKIIHNRIITSQSFEVKLAAPPSLDSRSIKIHQLRHQDLHDGISEQEAITRLLAFIGNRPLVGYYIHYDKRILDLACRRQLGFPLPNPVIEVSQIYQEKLERLLPNANFDLSLDAICHHLGLPQLERHDALQDAITAALVYVRLTQGDLPSSYYPAPR